MSSNLPMRRETGLARDAENGKLGGVCAGLARWTGTPVMFWRLAFAVSFFGYGLGLAPYVILWAVMDDRSDPKPQPRALGPSDLGDDDREIWDAVKEDMASLNLHDD